MKYRLIHFFSRLSNRLRQGKDQKKEWNRFADLSLELPEIKEVKPNTSLIVRLDDIGDFVLFAPVLANWIQIQTNEVFLLGNIAWKSYFEALIPQDKIQCIWLDKKEWFGSKEYRISIINSLEKIAPEQVIYASYTRVLLLDAILKKCLKAAQHFAWEAKPGPYSHELNAGYQFLKKPIIGQHETLNNLSFFNELQEVSISPNFKLDFPIIQQPVQEKYFIICPGGNQKSKQWPARNFAEIANKTMSLHPDLVCVLVGGPSDESFSNEIIKGIKTGRCLNLCGKTSLLELAAVCKQADFAFSNDTSAAHLCALQNTPVFVVLNGNRYQRFFPYPASFSQVFTVYPKLDEMKYDWEEKMPITAVSVSELWEKFLKRA